MNREELISRIIEIGNKEDIKIEFTGNENNIDFSVWNHQPTLNFDLCIHYSSIRSRQCFYLNIPALNLYQKDDKGIDDFIKSINRADEIIRDLNYLVSKCV
jgi:hypothetical protein